MIRHCSVCGKATPHEYLHGPVMRWFLSRYGGPAHIDAAIPHCRQCGISNSCAENYKPTPTQSTPQISAVEPKTDFHMKNLKLQEAVAGVMPLFKQGGLRKDSWDEYWHTVYHFDRESNVVARRFVEMHSIADKQRDSAKRAYAWFRKELQRADCRITDKVLAQEAIEDLSSALRFAGF